LERYNSVSRAAKLIGSALVHHQGQPISQHANAGLNRRREVGVLLEDGSPCVVV
jgi:hypothetical protein